MSGLVKSVFRVLDLNPKVDTSAIDAQRAQIAAQTAQEQKRADTARRAKNRRVSALNRKRFGNAINTAALAEGGSLDTSGSNPIS